MKIKVLVIVISIFVSNPAFSQSFYEMDFNFTEDNDTANYHSFFFLNADGTGTMRILVQDDTNIYECELKRGYPKDKDNKTDYSKMYYVAQHFTTAVGDSTGVTYTPYITFWFKTDPNTGYYEPWKVMSTTDGGQKIQGKISYVHLLQKEDLTKTLILRYYTANEPMYTNLFAANIRVVPPELKTSRLFLLTVIDTEDDHIGPDCKKDREKQQQYFTKIAEKLELGKPIIMEVLGKELSRENVLKKINEIKPTKSDIVIFYYSGHGYSKDDNRLFPWLDLRYDKDISVRKENELNMEEIYDLIKQKPSRLNLVISDCCNWHLTVSNNRSTNIANTRPSSGGLSIENMQTLFMSPSRYSLLITAARKGQVSAGNEVEGGIFTNQLRDALQKFMGIGYQNISWQNIIENVQQQTETRAGLMICSKPENEKVFAPCTQTPMYKVN